MANKNVGKVTQIIGAVLDIKFSDNNLPEINDAINIPKADGSKLVVEVAQHLGDDTVRCIAMGPTDGLVRGMDAEAQEARSVSLLEKQPWDVSLMYLVNLSMKNRLQRESNTSQFTEKPLPFLSRQPIPKY